MKLFFSNQSFAVQKECPSVKKVKEWLDKQAKGELFDVWQVSSGTGIGVSTIMDHHKRNLTDYSYKYKQKMFFGNKATITYFKKEIQKNGNG